MGSIVVDVIVAPVCKTAQKSTYDVALNELVQVSCDVDSDPKNVSFKWFFNDSLNEIKSFSSNETRSVASYVPSSIRTYGKMICYGENRVGRQKDPCIFNIIPASMYTVYSYTFFQIHVIIDTLAAHLPIVWAPLLPS